MNKEEQINNNNEIIDLSKISETEVPGETEEKQKPRYVFPPGTPKISQWLVKYSGRLIKNKKQANYFLIGLAVLLFILSFYLVFFKTKSPKAIKTTEYPLNEGYGGRELPDDYR